ncbi:MAG: zinc ribbon domain-containing protein [Actinomycetes bacterium]
MANFCEQCGSELGLDAQYCGECGEPVEPLSAAFTSPPAVTLPAPAGESVNPAPKQPVLTTVTRGEGSGELPPKEQLGLLWASAAGPTDCPGCHQTQGSPGALCPACGSRYPSPRAALIGCFLLILGVLILLIALISTGGLLQDSASGSTKMSGLEATGWFAAIAGVCALVYSVGRNGPKTPTSCCGCSCVVVLLVIPAVGASLWVQGGPVLAAAIVPAAIPIVWLLDAATVTAWLLLETGRVLLRRTTIPSPG